VATCASASSPLALLKDLPQATVATDRKVLFFIERQVLMGWGIGCVDAPLLAAVALDGSARLWMRDSGLVLSRDAGTHRRPLATSLGVRTTADATAFSSSLRKLPGLWFNSPHQLLHEVNLFFLEIGFTTL
jgi:hypothetical protein